MSRLRVHRAFALRYDDGFRGLVSLLGSAPPIVAAILFMQFNDQRFFTNAVLIFAALCASFTLFFVIYMIWTHRVFARGDRAELMQIAMLQHRQGASGISRAIGMKTDEHWAMSAALTALMVSAVAATSAGTPRTRSGLTTMRTQTYISFSFNAIVVGMAVSLITSLIVAAGE